MCHYFGLSGIKMTFQRIVCIDCKIKTPSLSLLEKVWCHLSTKSMGTSGNTKRQNSNDVCTYIQILLLELSYIACIGKCHWALSVCVFCLLFSSFAGKTAETSCRSKKFDSCSNCCWSHPPNAWEEGLFAVPNKKCCFSGINVIARYCFWKK